MEAPVSSQRRLEEELLEEGIRRLALVLRKGEEEGFLAAEGGDAELLGTVLLACKGEGGAAERP